MGSAAKAVSVVITTQRAVRSFMSAELARSEAVKSSFHAGPGRRCYAGEWLLRVQTYIAALRNRTPPNRGRRTVDRCSRRVPSIGGWLRAILRFRSNRPRDLRPDQTSGGSMHLHRNTRSSQLPYRLG